ncbi:MAG: glycosyltransferase family 1 protein [bacterium]|nr:glycosyltransferase family 1 protein [bacterium]
MIIGINTSAALKENPTGVEEYVFQLIKHLAVIPESRAHRFILYLNPRLRSGRLKELQTLPENFELKFLSFPFGWTQIRLAWEMLNSKIDVLFIPVHILPLIHPKRSVVALHGLEYEYFPELYPFWHRLYLRWSTKYALKTAARIIAVSENTKKDLMKLYGGNVQKISVVYHGIGQEPKIMSQDPENNKRGSIVYIGRIEMKKNILGIIEAYNKFRQKNLQFSNKLILVGGTGFGFEKIASAINASAFKKDIVLKGYVTESEKNDLLKNSSVFLFPSFYEGFGLPVLEAQAAGVPVITSNTSCLPEVAGAGAVFVDPKNSREITMALEKVLSDEALRQDLIQAGYENTKRFSWEKCARETLKILIE